MHPTAGKPVALRAWIVWAVGACSFGYAWFQRVTPSVAVAELMAEFAIGAAVLGNLSALYLYAYAGLQLPVGALHDRFGPRRVLSVAALVSAAGALLFATAADLNQAYLGRLLVGIGSAASFVGGLALAQRWFPPERYAFVSGLTMMVAMAGGVFGQGPLAWAVQAAGWRPAVMGMAGLGLVLAVATWAIVRDGPQAVRRAAPGRRPSVLAAIAQAVRRPQNWVMTIYGGAIAGPLLAFGALWGVPYMMLRFGVERPAAAFTASLLLIGLGIGSPLAGYLSDRIGRRKPPMLLGAAASTLIWSLLVFGPDLPLLLFQGLVLLSGIFAGTGVIALAVVREVMPQGVAATVTGLVNTANVGIGAILQPLVGLLLDLGWRGEMAGGARVYPLDVFTWAFAVLPGVCLLALAAACLARETYCRPLPAG